MKIKKYKIIPILFFALFSFSAMAQDKIPDKIILSLKKGDAKVLSEFFFQNVELGILDNDNAYSKAQAQQIVTKFFSDYQAFDFTIIHERGNEGSKYVIGSLKTIQEVFRVSFLLRTEKGKSYIHQLRIEKQD